MEQKVIDPWNIVYSVVLNFAILSLSFTGIYRPDKGLIKALTKAAGFFDIHEFLASDSIVGSHSSEEIMVLIAQALPIWHPVSEKYLRLHKSLCETRAKIKRKHLLVLSYCIDQTPLVKYTQCISIESFVFPKHNVY